VENQRGVSIVFILGAVAIGVLVRSVARTVMQTLAWEDPTFGGVLTLSLGLGLVGGIVGFFVLIRNAKASSFTDEVLSELTRVTWPSRDETLNNTGIVVGATIFFSALLAVYDFTWAKITELFLYSSG
jgi:preprotein translocase SecE subunit